MYGFLSRRAKGAFYEKKAEAFLKKQGYKTLARNQTYRGSELDLIMHKGEMLLFVEVRARGSQALFSACESLDTSKIKHLIKGAQIFLQRNPQWQNHALRFDLICFDNDQLTWIENAIEMDF